MLVLPTRANAFAIKADILDVIQEIPIAVGTYVETGLDAINQITVIKSIQQIKSNIDEVNDFKNSVTSEIMEEYGAIMELKSDAEGLASDIEAEKESLSRSAEKAKRILELEEKKKRIETEAVEKIEYENAQVETKMVPLNENLNSLKKMFVENPTMFSDYKQEGLKQKVTAKAKAPQIAEERNLAPDIAVRSESEVTLVPKTNISSARKSLDERIQNSSPASSGNVDSSSHPLNAPSTSHPLDVIEEEEDEIYNLADEELAVEQKRAEVTEQANASINKIEQEKAEQLAAIDKEIEELKNTGLDFGKDLIQDGLFGDDAAGAQQEVADRAYLGDDEASTDNVEKLMVDRKREYLDRSLAAFARLLQLKMNKIVIDAKADELRKSISVGETTSDSANISADLTIESMNALLDNIEMTILEMKVEVASEIARRTDWEQVDKDAKLGEFNLCRYKYDPKKDKKKNDNIPDASEAANIMRGM